MATVSWDKVLVWTLRSSRPVGEPRAYTPSVGGDASLSPDGRTLAVTSELGIEILDATTLRQRTVLTDAAPAGSAVRFTRDGRHLVAASREGWTRLWSTRTWRPATRKLGGPPTEVAAHAVSPDGRTLATGDADGAIRLFDLAAQQPLGAPLSGLPTGTTAPQFTPDGAYLFAISDTGRAYRWDMRPASWARRACTVAGRTLTRTEWDHALPDRDYAPACAG